MKVIEYKNCELIFDNDKVLIIPTAEKPLKLVYSGKCKIKETEEDVKAVLLELINRVEAAGNDTDEFIDTLIREGKWDGMIV